MSAPQTIDDATSLSDCYQHKFMLPADASMCDFEPSAELNSKVGLIRASITNMEVDAVVNVWSPRIPVSYSPYKY